MAELWIYDIIGEGVFFDGVTAKGIRDQLADVDAEEEVIVRINSPGGDVFEAQAIRTMLSQRKAPVNVQVDGVAASAASWIATVGDRVSMAEGSMLMIHSPWTVAVGNRAELLAAADLLDKVGGQIANSYAGKSGKEMKDVMAAMDAETWYTADEAKAFGLVDEVLDVKAKAFAIPSELGYKNVPGQTKRPAASTQKLSTIARQRRVDLMKTPQYFS